MDVDKLGEIPLDPRIGEGGDTGQPLLLTRPDSAAASAFREVARRLKARGEPE
jgi:ATP-binding protein involved in chromosome partitioning